mmetsp:Transcript_27049/g.41097  ORF Transcript_27049/g.41097 Transcript_27049/m.41097 type:complete len:186 (+) Transcript_27049:44-601(+)
MTTTTIDEGYYQHHVDENENDVAYERKCYFCDQRWSVDCVIVLNMVHLVVNGICLIPVIGYMFSMFLCLFPYMEGLLFSPIIRSADTATWLWVYITWIMECLVYALLIYGARTFNGKVVAMGAAWYATMAIWSIFTPGHNSTLPYRPYTNWVWFGLNIIQSYLHVRLFQDIRRASNVEESNLREK